MQMPLKFEEDPQTEAREETPRANVWPTLDAQHQSQTRSLLARLLAKAAATSELTQQRKGVRDD